MLASEADSLVERDPQPTEGLDDIILGSRDKAVGIGIFYSEHEITSVLLGKEVVEESRTHSSDV